MRIFRLFFGCIALLFAFGVGTFPAISQTVLTFDERVLTQDFVEDLVDSQEHRLVRFSSCRMRGEPAGCLSLSVFFARKNFTYVLTDEPCTGTLPAGRTTNLSDQDGPLLLVNPARCYGPYSVIARVKTDASFGIESGTAVSKGNLQIQVPSRTIGRQWQRPSSLEYRFATRILNGLPTTNARITAQTGDDDPVDVSPKLDADGNKEPGVLGEFYLAYTSDLSPENCLARKRAGERIDQFNRASLETGCAVMVGPKLFEDIATDLGLRAVAIPRRLCTASTWLAENVSSAGREFEYARCLGMVDPPEIEDPDDPGDGGVSASECEAMSSSASEFQFGYTETLSNGEVVYWECNSISQTDCQLNQDGQCDCNETLLPGTTQCTGVSGGEGPGTPVND